MKQKRISINSILNVIRKLLTLIFPVITLPYAIKILGVENIGKVAYGHSIITYFALFAMLGISQYAIREGARRKDDKKQLDSFVSEVFTINLCSTFISYVVLFLCIAFVPKFNNYTYLLLIQSISIILTTLSVDWINTVFEDFLLLTLRSIITYIIMFAFLFIFVRRAEDYYMYALLTVISDAIICVTNLFYCRKYTKVRITFHPNFKKHIKPILVFFANALAVSIYVSIDTTMLGWIKGDYDVGIYSLAVKIYVAVKGVLIAIYNVSISRLAYLWKKEEKDKFKGLFSQLFGCVTILLVPATIGLIVVSKDILYVLGGEEYVKSTLTLQILSFALIFAIFGGLVCDCLNVAVGREKDNMIAAISAAAVNFLLNLWFIPKYSYIGAAITTLISEVFVVTFCLIRIPNKKNYIDIKPIITSIIHSLIGSLLIVAISFLFEWLIDIVLLRLVVVVTLSIITYFAFMLVVKDSFFMKIVTNVLKRFKILNNNINN